MTFRRAFLGLLLLALAASLALAFYLWLLRGSGLPLRDGEVRVPELEAPVEVRWDGWGVPHVTGESGRDLAAALGYLHANDRFTQMELGRRAASGRLSELFGRETVALDRKFRTLRLRRAAESDWEALGGESRAVLEAYAAGVNAWLAARGRDLPPGLRLLRVRPEPWSPLDSLAFVYLMAHELSFWAGRPEEDRFVWLRELGPELTRELVGEPDLHIPEELLTRFMEAAAWVESAMSFPEGPPGSNNWAVGASLTVSGAPLVANDPHLPLQLPALWYQVLLRAPDYEVAGMTLPGLPGVVIGMNRHLAWALTHSMLDDHDLFFEELDEAGRNVLRGETWLPLEAEEEVIRVRGGADVTVWLFATDHGPLLAPDPAKRLPPRSLAWTAYYPSDPVAVLLNLARASMLEGALAGLEGHVIPAENLVVADRQGGLLVTLLGNVPERRRGDGRLPSPGWDLRYGWDGLRPASANPVLLDPAEDFVVTANDDVRPADYELPFVAEFDTAHRAERVAELLRQRRAWSAREMARIQTDVVSLYAREVVAHLEGPFAGDAGRAYRELAAWDGEMALAGRSALFVVVERELRRELLGEVVERHEMPGMFQRRLLLRTMRGEMSEEWLRRVVGIEPGELGARQEAALERAWRAGMERWGEEPARWSYGDIHRLRLEHPLAGLPLVGRWYRGHELPVAGSATTVSAFGSTWDGDWLRIRYGASVRWVADLADGDASLAVLPGGQSGHPFDHHYDDQIDLYGRGEMRPVLWSDEAIRAATGSLLTMSP